jgi:hypothetical protein
MTIELTSAVAVMAALRKRFDGPAYALFENVSNGTGSRATRWADAIAMSVWPSRGLDIHGIEIKVDRNDVLRELKNPHKAETVAKHCDFFWLAVGNAKIVGLDEVPQGWGLLVPFKNSMKAAKDAARIRPGETRSSVDRDFVASLLRRAAEHYDPQRIRETTREEIFSEVYEQVRATVERNYTAEIEQLCDDRDRWRNQAESLDRQLKTLSDSPFPPELVARSVELLRMLTGWQGCASEILSATRGLEMVLRHAESAQESLAAVHRLALALAEVRQP